MAEHTCNIIPLNVDFGECKDYYPLKPFNVGVDLEKKVVYALDYWGEPSYFYAINLKNVEGNKYKAELVDGGTLHLTIRESE